MSIVLHVCVILFLSIVQSYGVDILNLCNSGNGYDKLIRDEEQISMTINTSVWPDHLLKCTLILRARDMSDDLYYEFSNFNLVDSGTSIRFESASYAFYSLKAEYSKLRPPNLGSRKRTDTYLKLIVNRASSTETSLRTTFTIYTEDYYNSWDPRLRLTLGTIIGIVAGIITVIVFIVFVVCCLCAKSRRNAGVAMVPRPGVTTTTTTVASRYPYGAPPEQYAMHPVYPASQMAAYPPGVYPGPNVTPYPAQPPPYNELGYIRSAQPKV